MRRPINRAVGSAIRSLLPLHFGGQERVFTSKTAEGACRTPNGVLNAQAKGLTTVFAAPGASRRSLLERDRF